LSKRQPRARGCLGDEAEVALAVLAAIVARLSARTLPEASRRERYEVHSPKRLLAFKIHFGDRISESASGCR
jgi:hypothetical protein